MKKFIFITIVLILLMMTGCNRLSTLPDIGSEYKLEYNSMNDIGLINSENSYLIYGHILDYSFDSTFIIVAERPRDSVPECTGTIPGMTLKKSQLAFEQSTFRQYWIVNKKEKSEFNESTKIYSNVYGPYNKEEYLQKREAVGVPKELKLKE